MKPHALAMIFPELTGADFEALADDIAANGLRDPIVTHEDAILDGRNRFRACEARGVERRFTVWVPSTAEDTPQAYVISVNLHRRHLSDSQRAMVAARLANHPGASAPGVPKRSHERNGATVAGGKSDGHITKADAAKMLNVSPSHVRMAKEVVAKAPPEVVAKVDSGTMKVGEAWRTEIEEKRGDDTWTPPRVEQLTTLWNDETPIRDIASTIGVSRSAVIGKADRLGLVSRGESPRRPYVKTHLAPKVEAPQFENAVTRIRDFIDQLAAVPREIADIPHPTRVELVRELAEALGVVPRKVIDRSPTGSTVLAAMGE
jgi:ParB-like chromosome segregation protein Spo0J